MNIVEGLTAANLALGLVKDLREIDRSLDDATYKLKIADIASALADAKIALADAKVRISDLESELAEKSQGNICPKCKTGRLKIVSVEKHQAYVGIEYHSNECSEHDCTYTNQRIYDANIGEYKGQE